MKRRSTVILLVLLAFGASAALAEVRMPGLFSDHMVLQRDRELAVWGWADPGEKVAVEFAGKSASAVAGADGKWMTKLPACPASAEPREMTVTGRNTVKIADILVGDVWLGSGQSNMEMKVRDITNAQAEIAASANPAIRLFTVPRVMKAQVAEDVDARWTACGPDTIPDFSAVLYLFGREINAEAKVPMGLIHSSVGGTRIELWTAPEGLAAVPEFAEHVKSIEDTEKAYQAALPAKLAALEAWIGQAKTALAKGRRVPVSPDWPDHPNPRDGAATLYHGMIHPLVPFALRGFVWYQGEWNGGENDIYVKRMHALVEGWRKVWGREDLPFYYVQLARMPTKEHEPWLGDGLAPTREAQRRSLEIPRTGMAVIIDLEGSSGWHPGDKQDVAKRLSRWALKNEYGQADLEVSGPLYKEMAVEGNKVRLRFDHAESGLVAGEKPGLDPMKPVAEMKTFAVAGADRKWFPAKAEIAGREVVVSAPEVPAPVAVRYAYCNDPVGGYLYNQEGLPASPFRTDDW